MTVQELIEVLRAFPATMPVVMSKDSEGNSHSPLAEAAETMYLANSTWSRETYPTHEEIVAGAESGYTDEDEAPDRAVRAVCLWPVS